MKQEMMGWHWHRLDRMQIIFTLLQTDNDASTSLFNIYRLDALLDAQPTVSLKAITTCEIIRIHGMQMD